MTEEWKNLPNLVMMGALSVNSLYLVILISYLKAKKSNAGTNQTLSKSRLRQSDSLSHLLGLRFATKLVNL